MASVTRVLIGLMLIILVEVVLPQSALAATVRMTMYDDGKSCPGSCDAHVVFDPTMNGTEFAHLPSAKVKPFGACVKDSDCEICLESGLKQCLVVMYRGAGPSKNTFDLTPAFYQGRCALTDIPALLQTKCKELDKAASGLKDRINCIKDADNLACKALMNSARLKQRDDTVIYDKCRSEGEARFNKDKPKAQRRANACAYEFEGTGGPNSKGTHWRKLLPGACREGTYVGRDGLDCCSGNTLSDGSLGLECRAFYPSKS